jgi:hypothetical protein
MLVRLQAQAPSMAALESDFAAVDHQTSASPMAAQLIREQPFRLA